MSEFWAMGGYAAYVWPAYGVSALALAGATIWTVAAWRRAKARLALLDPRGTAAQQETNR